MEYKIEKLATLTVNGAEITKLMDGITTVKLALATWNYDENRYEAKDGCSAIFVDEVITLEKQLEEARKSILS